MQYNFCIQILVILRHNLFIKKFTFFGNKSRFAPNVSRLVFFSGGNINSPANTANTCVIGIAGNKAYHNGNDLAVTIPAGSGTISVAIPIGAMNDDGVRSLYFEGEIAAVAIYNTIISAAQITALSGAMLSL